MLLNNPSDRYRKIVIESLLIQKHFPCFNTRFAGNTLVGRARIKPSDGSETYRVELEYCPNRVPVVRVIEPSLEYSPEIHMYKNDTLCLYDWREMPWQHSWHLHETIIPWTSEWLVFYELFLLTGKWLGRAAAHGASKKVEPELIKAGTK